MRKFLSILLVLFVTLGLVFSDAQARRFGGGRSFGSQRTFSSFSRTASPAAASRGFNWGGMVTGLIIGGLISSLFFGHGFGASILSWAFVLGVAFLLYSLLRNQRSMNTQQSSNQQNFSSQQYAPAASGAIGVNDEDFLRAAKVLFMRMQADYDAKNLEDIRQFTSPEVCAEIQIQFQERGDAVNTTEVVTLNAEILDASPSNASARFSGMIKEDTNQPAAAFAEIWHFEKNTNSQKWIVSGIQQN